MIVGGGFGGQALALALRKTPVELLMIDPNNYLTFQPLLYQVATAGLEPEEIVYPIRGVFRNQLNYRFRLGKVDGVDFEENQVILDTGERIDYEFLALAAGSTPHYFGIEGAREHSFPMKSLPDAIALRSHILHRFELADQYPERIQDGLLNFVVIGGGPTGVETAGALVELLQHSLPNDYPDLRLDKARVILIEGGPHLLGPFKPDSRKHAYEALREQGVHIMLSERVVRVTPHAVHLDSKKFIRTNTPIWAVGVRANPLADRLGLDQTRGGRVVVNADLSLPDRPNVFVVGDMAASADGEGALHPQLASVARQAGRHVGHVIQHRLRQETAPPFVYRNPGIMATVSRHAAVAEFPGDIRLEGFFAWMSWLVLHLILLVGFHNRMHVFISWLCTYLTHNRSARLILHMGHHDEIAEATPPAKPPAHRLPDTQPALVHARRRGQTAEDASTTEDPLRHIHLLLEQRKRQRAGSNS
ncbi:MAG: NAD(P)/FAD-dependent oxidoreductase [Rhodothermales bacterium]